MTLQQIAPGNKSSSGDVDQLPLLLNGTTTDTPVLVSNRIQAAMPGSTASSALVGGVKTTGDKAQNGLPRIHSGQQDSAVKAAPPAAGTTWTAGDLATDAAGLFWIATANTSGTTPWVSVGKGGDAQRTRATLLTGVRGAVGGAPLGPAQNFAGWDYGGIQYNYVGTAPSNGFLVPTTGYYSVTCSMKATLVSSWYRLNWIKNGSIVSTGDISQHDPYYTPSDGGSVSEDVLQLSKGDFIQPYVQLTGTAILGTAANDPLPDDFTVYVVIEMLYSSLSI